MAIHVKFVPAQRSRGPKNRDVTEPTRHGGLGDPVTYSGLLDLQSHFGSHRSTTEELTRDVSDLPARCKFERFSGRR